MTLTFERLAHNTLPLPGYKTKHAAGFDFAACLTRPCQLVEPGTGERSEFWVAPTNGMSSFGRTTTDPGATDPSTLILMVSPDETILVPLGFKCAFPTNLVLKLYPRSSVGLRGLMLANSTAIIDSDFRGDLFVGLINRTGRRIQVAHGERIVQGVLLPVCHATIGEGIVDDTERGTGGLGSTGRFDPQVSQPAQISRACTGFDLTALTASEAQAIITTLKKAVRQINPSCQNNYGASSDSDYDADAD